MDIKISVKRTGSYTIRLTAHVDGGMEVSWLLSDYQAQHLIDMLKHALEKPSK